MAVASFFEFFEHVAGFDVGGKIGFGTDEQGLVGGDHRFNAPDGPAIAGDDQGLALFKLVQDGFGFLMQLFGRDGAHSGKVTPAKCHHKFSLQPRLAPPDVGELSRPDPFGLAPQKPTLIKHDIIADVIAPDGG